MSLEEKLKQELLKYVGKENTDKTWHDIEWTVAGVIDESNGDLKISHIAMIPMPAKYLEVKCTITI